LIVVNPALGVLVGRAIGAVVVAFLLWTVLWLGFAAAMRAALPDLIDPAGAVTHRGVLLGYITYSVVISALAGYVCAAVGGAPAKGTVRVFALVLLVVGIGVEVSAWALTPAWYHLVFLALLMPATMWGGRLRERRADSAAVA
jgi:hypothetical protein